MYTKASKTKTFFSIRDFSTKNVDMSLRVTKKMEFNKEINSRAKLTNHPSNAFFESQNPLDGGCSNKNSIYQTPDLEPIKSIIATDKLIITYSYQENLRYWDKYTMQCLFSGNFPVEQILPNGDILQHDYRNKQLKFFNHLEIIADSSTVEPYRFLELPVLSGKSSFYFTEARQFNYETISVSLDKYEEDQDREGAYCKFKIYSKDNQLIKDFYWWKSKSVFKLCSDNSIIYSQDEKLFFIDSSTKIEHKILGHQGQIISVAERHDNTFVTGSVDNTLRVWSREGENIATLMGHIDNVRAIVILPNNDIVSGSKDTTLRIWDGKTFECKQTIAMADTIYSLSLEEDGNLIAGLDKGKLERINLFNGDCELSEGFAEELGSNKNGGVFF